MRGCIVLLAEGDRPTSGAPAPALVTGQEVKCQVLDWYSRKHSRVVRSTYAAELLSLLDAVGQGNIITTALDEIWSGATSATKMIERQATGRRAIEHDAGVDARAVFEGVIRRDSKDTDGEVVVHARPRNARAPRVWLC